MNHKKLESKFPNQRLVRVITTKPDSRLSLKETWVYSTLLWRYRRKPISKARLAKWTGIDRTRTLPRILTKLTNLGLVAISERKYAAVEPTGDLLRLFATWVRGMGNNEKEVVSYNWAVYEPDRNIIDGLVAAADCLGKHTAAKLAKRFGVCSKTISASRRRLKMMASTSQPENHLSEKKIAHEESKQPLISLQKVDAPRPAIATRNLAHDHARFHGLESGAASELERLCGLLKALSSKEFGQIVSALVRKYGKSDGLEEAIWFLIRQHPEYIRGVSYDKVMRHIGIGCGNDNDDDDDELCIFSEDEASLNSSW